LALVSYLRPNLLLLDEPTNHLDLEMRQALAMALQDYEAAVVLVSHDRHLLRAVADELILVDQGRAQPFDGDLDDYAKWFQTREAAETASDEAAPAALSAEQKKQRKREEAERRNRLSPLRADIARLEKQLAKLEQERTTVETALAEPDVYNPSSKQKLQDLLQKQTQLKRDISNIETEWLTASEKLEAELSAGE
jgi:ATP-binding cassette subfamily F protein 3